MDLKILTDTQNTAKAVWASISQPRPTTSIPVPSRILQYNAILRSWPSQLTPWRLDWAMFPPVEKDMMALTFLCPTRLTSDHNGPRFAEPMMPLPMLHAQEMCYLSS